MQKWLGAAVGLALLVGSVTFGLLGVTLETAKAVEYSCGSALNSDLTESVELEGSTVIPQLTGEPQPPYVAFCAEALSKRRFLIGLVAIAGACAIGFSALASRRD